MNQTKNISGNVFFLLFAAVAVVGALGVSVQSYIIGPLKTATAVNKKSAVDSQMEISVRVATVNSANKQANNGDCDSDGLIEPIPPENAAPASQPVGGGLLPISIAGSVLDPWNNRYGYCVWDHGTSNNNAGGSCAAQGARLAGTNTITWNVMTIISPGPNKIFETTCNAWADGNADLQPDTPLVQKPAGSDDIYLEWKYNDATTGSGGLWTEAGVSTATISKNLSVKDTGGTEQLSFDTASKILSVGTGGAGNCPTLGADTIELMTMTNPSLELLNAISFFPEDSTGTTFTLQNATGDGFRLSDGTVTMLDLDKANNRIKFGAGASANEFMSYYNIGDVPFLRLESDADNALATEIRLGATNEAGIVNKNPTIYARHRAADNVDTDTSGIQFNLSTLGVAPTNMSGFMDFLTRRDMAAGPAATQRMVISDNGSVGIGVNPSVAAGYVTRSLAVAGGDVYIEGNVAAGTYAWPPEERLDLGGSVLDDNSAIRIGNGGELCSPIYEGVIRYNDVPKCIELCDGTAWKCLQVESCSAFTSNNIVFWAQVNSPTNTVVNSNIRSIGSAGNCNLRVSISGEGSPQYRICTVGTDTSTCDASEVVTWTSSPNYILNGQFIQLRNTTPATTGVTRTAVVSVGAETAGFIVAAQSSCADTDPTIGTWCADGTTYLGRHPVTNTKTYAQRCYIGQSWSGSACTGTATSFAWSTNNTGIATAATNGLDGIPNTNLLAGLVNADSPYPAATACFNLVEGGKSDWYLPANNESHLLLSGCNNINPTGDTCNDNNNQFWTSTQNTTASQAWYYNFRGGPIATGSKSTLYTVKCIRRD